jgi:hypothetical protein
VAPALFDSKLLRDVVDVALRAFPVDIVQAKALLVAVDGLLQAGAQGEQLVDALVGGDQAVEGCIGQGLDGVADVGLGEGSGPPLEDDLVVLPEPRLQHTFQDDAALFAAAQGQRLLRREVLVPPRHQQPHGGDLGDEFFFE